MKECDILRQSKHTLTLPTYFRGSEPPNPQDVCPWWATRSIVGRTTYEPWSMRIVDDGSPAPTFGVLSWVTITLSPVEQQRHWLEETVCLELIRHKDGTIVSKSRISEGKVMVSNCSSLMLWNLQLYSNSFEWTNVTFSGWEVKTYSDPSYIFSGGHDPNPQDLRPCLELRWLSPLQWVLNWQVLTFISIYDNIC